MVNVIQERVVEGAWSSGRRFALFRRRKLEA